MADYATILTAPGFNDESSPTITFELPKNTTGLVFEIGIFDENGMQSFAPYRKLTQNDLAKKSYTFVLKDGEKQNLYRATQFTQTILIKYYIRTTMKDGSYRYSSLQRGYSTVNADPIIEPSVIDINPNTTRLTDSKETLVKGYSQAVAKMTVTPQKGAVLNEDFYRISNSGNVVYSTEHQFDYPETNLFHFSAEDSRGCISEKILTAPMIDYIPLTCNIVDSKPDALGSMQLYCYGNYFNDSFGKVANSLNVKCRYAEVGGSYSEWITMSKTLYDESYTAYANFDISNFNQQKAYIFEVEAKDELETITKNTLPIKSVPIFHWGEEDFVFEVPVKFVDGVIGLPIDDLPEISNGIWTPYLLGDAISSYTKQIGTYSKVGQVVTVGFYIKATCKSGYQTTVIEINGLPFVPLLQTAGGGMASRTFVPGGMTFQCYVAETTGKITTRVQGCGHETAGNLATSADGCCYRSGGGEITLSGTITYISNS